MNKPLGLFEAVGIEIEYMIVSQQGLNVLPVTDQLLHKAAGSYVSETEQGPLAWSNELALHVVELKTNGPAKGLSSQLGEHFQQHVQRINRMLDDLNGQLLPTAMHPWMDPDTETQLWPHEHNPIYEAYNRIFDCRGHGWSNLQSMHINLPFANDDEFTRLHDAIRLLLPLLPAIAASSPYAAQRYQGMMDYRLEVYRHNADRIPSITGHIIPERVVGAEAYLQTILQPMYRDIAPFDPQGILQEEWLNSRGAIARFDRNTIEIRVLDCQECPQADIAIADAIVSVLRTLSDRELPPIEEGRLSGILLDCARLGDQTRIDDETYLRALGLAHTHAGTAADIWSRLLDQFGAMQKPHARIIERILANGCLARRLYQALGDQPDRDTLHRVYGDLTDYLDAGELYIE
jgi:carboxylate-amine ligase